MVGEQMFGTLLCRVLTADLTSGYVFHSEGELFVPQATHGVHTPYATFAYFGSNDNQITSVPLPTSAAARQLLDRSDERGEDLANSPNPLLPRAGSWHDSVPPSLGTSWCSWSRLG